MSHDCEDCGATFETLSRLRLHDCSDDQPADATADRAPDTSAEPSETTDIDREKLEREYPDVVGKLPKLVADARTGDLSALSRAIAEYERVLTEISLGNAPGGEELHTDVLFAYYEPLADGLDAAAKTEGWDALVEYTDAYDLHEDAAVPEITHVIANGISRSVIRTCRNDGVDAIPPAALAYLGAIPEYVDEFHIAYEEAYTYGWGIGHPDHAVADQLLELAEAEPKFVKIALNTAFYVDQHAALDVFETLVTDEDISGTRDMLGSTTDLTEFFFKAVADLETPELLGPHAPMYWAEDDDLPRVAGLDPDVNQRIRDLARETGVADGLSAGWSLHDLEGGMMSELMGRSDSHGGSH